MKPKRSNKGAPLSWRVDIETKRQIVALAEKWGCGMTAAGVRCIERAYTQEMNMGSSIRIEHSDRNSKEFGYGLYINAHSVDDNLIYASECLPKDATDEQIKAAEKRVREKARYHIAKLGPD